MCAIAQLLNTIIWLKASNFSRKRHMAHFICAILCMTMTVLSHACSFTGKPIPSTILSIYMEFQIMTFAYCVALKKIQFLIAVVVPLLAYLVCLGVIWRDHICLYDIFVAVNSFLGVCVLAVSICILWHKDQQTATREEQSK